VGISGEETCSIVERLKRENRAFRILFRQIAQCPRTFPEMCSVVNGARMVLEKYRISDGLTDEQWAEIEKHFG